MSLYSVHEINILIYNTVLRLCCIKGTVSRDFRPLFFEINQHLLLNINQSTPPAQHHALKYFRIWFRIRGDFRSYEFDYEL
jgi:hypothetical protein